MKHPQRMDRREALKWIVAASAAISVLNIKSFGAPPARPGAHGYGPDPDVMGSFKPGDLWPLTFNEEQRATVTALCDVIIPADERSPAASSLKVPDFIDEWISVPYPEQAADRTQILEGLAWLEGESDRRFQKKFPDLTDEQKHSICDDLCFAPKARPEFRLAAGFFAKFRNLTAGGFYTTTQGWKDLQYIGNVPLLEFSGPPPEVLAFLKLA